VTATSESEFEGESLQALPVEGATRAPTIDGQGETNVTTRLEAFMHQVKEYAKAGEGRARE
jgi:hypothetical protein